MQFEKHEIKIKNEPAAQLWSYIMANSDEIDPDRRRPAIIICPGGGYEYTSDREAEPVALRCLGAGLQAFVLHYSVAPIRYPVALHQLAQSVAYVRDHAATLHVDPDRIIVAGFSAGGHLAASLGVFWRSAELADLDLTPAQIRPNGLMLAYPVITTGTYAHQDSFKNLLGLDTADLKSLSLEYQVNNAVPETFIWHTMSDQVVPMENTLLFVQALRKHQIPLECHLFPVGPHGASLANDQVNGNPQVNQPEIAVWFDLFITWLNNRI